MVDPYEFIVRESVVSSSQEDLLKRIPGWQEQQEAGSPSSPSQAPLALSRLCASGGSSSDEEEREPASASAFCMQEPLEWASPEACQDDSYNPAFESDRSRSLSPLAPLHVYGDLWASRLITQSQNDAVMSHLGVCDLPLAEEAAKQNPPQAEVGFELSYRQQKNVHLLQGISGQARNSKPVALSDTQKQVGVTPSRDIPNGSYSSVDREKDFSKAEILDGNGKLHIVEPLETRSADKLASFFDHTSKKKSLSVAVDETATAEATVRSGINSTAAGATSFCIVENSRKRKDEEGDCAFATTAQKLKFSKEPNYEQQHSKLENEAIHHNVKGPQSRKQLGEDCVAGSSDTKCLLPFVSDKENISTHRMQRSTSGETEMVRDNAAMDCPVMRLFPESVMDVMMLVSEALPSPSPHDPDFLSIVMSTGVSLPLPFRDCSGRLISKKSIS